MNTQSNWDCPPILLGRRVLNPEYRDPRVARYRGNPLIEALPPILDEAEAAEKLSVPVRGFDPADRQLPTHLRRHCVGAIRNFVQASPIHGEMEKRFSALIRDGYEYRNPKHIRWNEQIKAGVEAIERLDDCYQEYMPTSALGYNIIGISGVGKSTAVNSILRLYPQRIDHPPLRPGGSAIQQVVWLKMTCSFDGGLKQLCFQIFSAFDAVCGTSYASIYGARSRSAESMRPDVANVAARHALGVLVIDEIQFLSAAKAGGRQKMLQFFTALINDLQLPVVLVGTYKAFDLFLNNFSDARRGCGQGDHIWDPMERTDPIWEDFVHALLDYQYTRNPVGYSEELSDALFDVSQGITDIAVKAFILGQIRAMETGLEIIDGNIIRSVASDSIRLVGPALKALRSRNWRLLAQYEDLMRPDATAPRSIEARSSNSASVHLTSIPPEPEFSSDEDVASSQSKDATKPRTIVASEAVTEQLPRRKKSKIPRVKLAGSLVDAGNAAAALKVNPYEAIKGAGFIRSALDFPH